MNGNILDKEVTIGYSNKKPMLYLLTFSNL